MAIIEIEIVIVWLFANELFADIKSFHFVRYDRDYFTKNSCLAVKRALSFRTLLNLYKVSQFPEDKEDLTTVKHGFSTVMMSSTKCVLKKCEKGYDIRQDKIHEAQNIVFR